MKIGIFNGWLVIGSEQLAFAINETEMHDFSEDAGHDPAFGEYNAFESAVAWTSPGC